MHCSRADALPSARNSAASAVETVARRAHILALCNDETPQPCDGVPEILVLVPRGEGGIEDRLHRLVRVDEPVTSLNQAVGDLLHAFEHRTERIGHVQNYTTRRTDGRDVGAGPCESSWTDVAR
jgi:hypothetical protein